MAIIREINGKKPQWGNNCWFAENATIVGDVIMGEGCTVWFGAIVRGDVHEIRIGNYVNIQDNAILHATYQKSPLYIGNNVSIGHGAIVHGCRIGNNVLIGMGAIIMDDVVIEDNCIIAAGAVVTKGKHIPSGTVYGGVPAQKISNLSPEDHVREIERIARNYSLYASWYDEN
ncbi:MAG: gamma carbonic anhydrase family protein [Bacteroidales bacterium]|nr:gamma carbonic anhydrase family protein [Bacteroidales bacterium]